MPSAYEGPDTVPHTQHARLPLQPRAHTSRVTQSPTRAPTNRRQSKKLTRTSLLCATHVRAAARSALLRAARTARPRSHSYPASGRPAQTPVSETVLWCLRKEIRIIFLTGDETLFQEAEKMGAKLNTGGHCPALESGNSVPAREAGHGEGSSGPSPECGRGRKATPLGLPGRGWGERCGCGGGAYADSPIRRVRRGQRGD